MAKDKLLEELEDAKAKIEQYEKDLEYFKKLTEAGDGAHKSEAVKELFDFTKDKLPQRTRLNEKEIVTLTAMKTNMQLMNPKETRLGPELWMENLMELKISYKGLGREEGMGIFRLQSEEKDMQDGYKP